MANSVIVKFTKHGSALNVKSNKAAAAVDAAFNSKHAGKFLKGLLTDCKEFKEVTNTLNKAYLRHIEITMPYLDNGMRMKDVETLDAYLSEISGFKNEVADKMRALEPVYQSEVAKDIQRLGDLADPLNYPTWEAMRYKYGIDVKVFPTPNKQDFRFPASAEVQKQLDDVLEEAKIAGREKLFYRARVAVSRLKESSEKEEKTRRHESSITNIQDLADVMGILNVHDDAEVRYLAAGLKEVIQGVTIWDLRNSDVARKEVVDRCRKFLASTGGGGFTPPTQDVVEEVCNEPEELRSSELVDSLV